MYKRRYLEEEVRFLATQATVVLVVGPCQEGKSTLLKNLFPEFTLVLTVIGLMKTFWRCRGMRL